MDCRTYGVLSDEAQRRYVIRCHLVRLGPLADGVSSPTTRITQWLRYLSYSRTDL